MYSALFWKGGGAQGLNVTPIHWYQRKKILKGREEEVGVQKKMEREREGIKVSVKDLKMVEKVDSEDVY